MNDLVKFEFEGNRIRVLIFDNRKWFVLIDVCKVLRLSNISMVASRLDDDEKRGVSVADPTGRLQNTTIINLSGLLNVCGRSDKQEAKRLAKWGRQIAAEVIETGKYKVPSIDVTDPKQLASLTIELIAYVQVLSEQKEEVEKRAVKAETAVVESKPKVEFYDKYANAEGLFGFREAAKALGIPPKEFVDWLIDNDYCFRERRSLTFYSRWKPLDLFAKRQKIIIDTYGDERAVNQTYITPVGIQYFSEKLHKEAAPNKALRQEPLKQDLKAIKEQKS
jgi:phage antirepressor YoqD-like protein